MLISSITGETRLVVTCMGGRTIAKKKPRQRGELSGRHVRKDRSSVFFVFRRIVFVERVVEEHVARAERRFLNEVVECEAVSRVTTELLAVQFFQRPVASRAAPV